VLAAREKIGQLQALNEALDELAQCGAVEDLTGGDMVGPRWIS
jgi:hypothetical protein